MRHADIVRLTVLITDKSAAFLISESSPHVSGGFLIDHLIHKKLLYQIPRIAHIPGTCHNAAVR